MLKPKNTLLALALLPVLWAVAPTAAEATPITGTIFFSGNGTWIGGNNLTATGFDFNSPIDIDETISTGAYAGLLPGTTADFTDLTGSNSFGAPGTVGALAVSPLWTFLDAGTGWTYSFILTSVAINTTAGTARIIEGRGTATITGDGSPYEATLGNWTFSSTNSNPTIRFSASSTVPDGGATLALLGGALLGLGAVRRRFNL